MSGRRVAIAAFVVLAAIAFAPAAHASGPDYVYSREYFKSRFGDVLRADVYLPAKDGKRKAGRFPVVLEYDFADEVQRDADESSGQSSLSDPPLDYVKHGYVFAVVGQPGTGGSEGPQGIYDRRVQLSGVDAVEWAGTRPWSTGAVGMYGQSGPGIAQPLVAQYRPAHLRTIVPVVTTTDWYRDVLCRGGMPTSWERLVLVSIVLADYNGTNGITIPRTEADIDQFAGLWSKKLAHGWLPPSPEWFPRPNADDPLAAPGAWADLFTGCGDEVQAISPSPDVSRINVPIWSFGSYNDFFLLGNLELYAGATDSPDRRLTLDLAGHDMPHHGYEFAAETLRWYDRWLKGIRNGVDSEPPVDYFTIEQNRWHHAADWPLPTGRATRLYLNGGAPASPFAKGTLTSAAPTGADGSDTYAYDPLAGRHAGTFGILTTHADGQSDNVIVRNEPNGPGDQRLDAADSLVYLGDPLKRDTQVTGPINATLYASTTSRDTDWVVKLIDAFPDGATDPTTGPQPGYWGLATTGWLSGTRRDDIRKPVPIPVGKVLAYHVPLLPTSYLFKAGHRIGVMIASADASRTWPNPNPAVNTVFHDSAYPTHIDLPVVSPR